MRLDQLEERMGDAIAIEWKAFLLRPEPKAPDQDAFVEYTRSWMRPAEMEPAAHFRVWATDNPQPTSSIPPHVAAKAVALIVPDAERDFHRRLLAAYFDENRTISDWEVLSTLAGDVGIEPTELTGYVEEHGQHLTQQVIDEHNEAINNEITAVPTTVIAGIVPLPGAQDVDTLEMWIGRVKEHLRSEAEGR